MKDEVLVITKAKPFQKEEFVDVCESEAAVTKFMKSVNPNAKKDAEGNYTVKEKNGEFILYFVHKTTVKK